MNANVNKNAHSTTIDLENLQQEYSNVLIKYKQSVTDYINYLNVESQQPCIHYSENSKNVNQKCYDYIWKKAGCTTTGVVHSDTDWAKSQTLNELIYDSFLWATLTDTAHREKCYGTTTNYNTSTKPDYNIHDKSLVTIKNSAYTGTGPAEQSNANTLQECKAECSSSSSCKGATFVGSKCNLRVGDSDIISSNDSYAIVPKGKQMLHNMNELNSMLMKINKQIMEKIKSSEPMYEKAKMQNNKKTQELIQNYKDLEDERDNIRKLLNEYETLDTSEIENQITVTKNYYGYIILV